MLREVNGGMRTADIDHCLPRHSGSRTARSLPFLIGAALLALPGCGQHDAPVEDGVPIDSPYIFERLAHHPASGQLPVEDIAVWRQPSGLNEDRFYAAVGSEGIMVHLANGAFLQRLAQSAASNLGVLYAMPVGEVVADFLVAVNPSLAQLTWFEINAGSGALRRLAGIPAEIGDTVAAVCTHSDEGAKRHRVVVVTHKGALQEWIAVAQAGKQPNFANRIVATHERTLQLEGAGGDCAVDQATGDIFVVVDAREVRRVGADWTLAPRSVFRSGEPQSLDGTVTSIDHIRGVGGMPLLLLVDQGGGRLVAADDAGRVLATIALAPKVATLRSAGDTVVVVTDTAAVQFASWALVSTRLGLQGAAATGGKKMQDASP